MKGAQPKPVPSRDLLLSLYKYKNRLGILIHKHSHGTARAGDVVGTLTKNGYLVCGVKKSRFYLHRLVWTIHYGEPPAWHLDHVDGDRTNNRITNLRACDPAKNSQNRRLVRGFFERGGMFVARVKKDGVCHPAGEFKSSREAAAAYWEKKREVHEFAPRQEHKDPQVVCVKG
jgi:hypothetical protein